MMMSGCVLGFLFCFKQKTAYEMRISDWSSDVCSSDLLGFVPVRKPGKLPVASIGIDYALEYGSDRLEMDPDAVLTGQRVVIVDDLIATGGTALARSEERRVGKEVSVRVDLGGRRVNKKKIKDQDLQYL